MSERSVQFSESISRDTISKLVIEYLKYILYYRGQFPLPLDQLKQSLNRSSKLSYKIGKDYIYSDNNEDISSNVAVSKAKEIKKKKFVDAIVKFDDFFTNLSSILNNDEVLEVVMNLGPNMMSPKELHRITLPTCSETTCIQNPSSFHQFRLQFFKTILHDELLNDPSSESQQPISVLLLLKTGVSLSEHMEQKRFYALPKKCKQVTVHFKQNCDHCSGERIDAGLWVRWKIELKGFKDYMDHK